MAAHQQLRRNAYTNKEYYNMCGSARSSLATFVASSACMAVVLWRVGRAQGPGPPGPPPHVRYLVLFVMAFACMQLVDAAQWRAIERGDRRANRRLARVVLPLVLWIELVAAYVGAVHWLGAPRHRMHEALLLAFAVGFAGWWCPDPEERTTVGPDGRLQWCGLREMGYRRSSMVVLLLFLAMLAWWPWRYYPDRTVGWVVVAFCVATFALGWYGGRRGGTLGTRWCWTANALAVALAVGAVAGVVR